MKTNFYLVAMCISNPVPKQINVLCEHIKLTFVKKGGVFGIVFKNKRGENWRPLLLIPKLLLMKTNFYLVTICISNPVPKMIFVEASGTLLTFVLIEWFNYTLMG